MLALREDGTVVGWGEFKDGQLGPESATVRQHALGTSDVDCAAGPHP